VVFSAVTMSSLVGSTVFKEYASIFRCELCRSRNWATYNTGMLQGMWPLKLKEGGEDTGQWEWCVGTWPLYGAFTMFFVTGRKSNYNSRLHHGLHKFPSPSHFNNEDESCLFLWNSIIFIQDYMLSQPKGYKSECSPTFQMHNSSYDTLSVHCCHLLMQAYLSLHE
jgi:hypothetical protein